MSWRFLGDWPSDTKRPEEGYTAWDEDYNSRQEQLTNYLQIDGGAYQLVPTEPHVTRDPYWNPRHRDSGAKPIQNYRGHTFQLWNDFGLPTPYFLNYHHDHKVGSSDFGFTQMAVDEADGVFLEPPSTAPEPMFKSYYPNSGLPYGDGPFDARNSRGGHPHSQLNRDMHYYTINKPPYKPWFKTKEEPYPHRAGGQYALADRNPLSWRDNETGLIWSGVTTPRPEAMDPVQNSVLMGDNPKAVMISTGESRLARRIESGATAKPAVSPKTEL